MNRPLPPLLTPIATCASWFYGAGVARRNQKYDRAGPRGRIDLPVISVGNITAGGTGKTPMVQWIVQRLCQMDHHPMIALRGYRAHADEPSDEEQEHRFRFDSVPLAVGGDRLETLRKILPIQREVDCVVMDDGFQHRQLHRDLDLVLIDATRNTMQDELLPRGWLREPLKNLSRADGVIVTRAESIDEKLAVQVTHHHGREPLAWCRHIWSDLDIYDQSSDLRTESPTWLAGKRVVTMFGTGHPQAITRQLSQAGAEIVQDIAVRDHEHYKPKHLTIIKQCCTDADALVVTRKDWVKLRKLVDLTNWSMPIVVPRLELEVFHGESALIALIQERITQNTSGQE